MYFLEGLSFILFSLRRARHSNQAVIYKDISTVPMQSCLQA